MKAKIRLEIQKWIWYTCVKRKEGIKLKVSRDKLDDKLNELIFRLDDRKSLYNAMETCFHIPISIVADICSKRKDISEVNDFIAFAFLKTIKESLLSTYFTETEIKAFSEMKYESAGKITGSLVFENMIQISDDQWVGRISARQLMQLKEAQLIKYNENTQRTLKRVVRGENRFYEISLNKRAVNEMKILFKNGAYIPDDITLNIDIDPDEYDPKEKTLTFSPPRIMDIIDGYHRYIAISKVCMEDPEFDYPMEIRIVSFSEEKAKQFIFQKDQKTKMKKADSESMNQFSSSNQVVDGLNTNSSSNLQGMISRNGGNIDYSFLSAVISSYYFPDKKGKYPKKEMIKVLGDLQKKFNSLTTEDMDWLEHVFTDREIQVIIFCFSKGISDNRTIRKVLEETEGINNIYFNLTGGGRIKANTVELLADALERVK